MHSAPLDHLIKVCVAAAIVYFSLQCTELFDGYATRYGDVARTMEESIIFTVRACETVIIACSNERPKRRPRRAR